MAPKNFGNSAQHKPCGNCERRALHIRKAGMGCTASCCASIPEAETDPEPQEQEEPPTPPEAGAGSSAGLPPRPQMMQETLTQGHAEAPAAAVEESLFESAMKAAQRLMQSHKEAEDGSQRASGGRSTNQAPIGRRGSKSDLGDESTVDWRRRKSADKMLRMMGEEVGMAAFLAASQMHSNTGSSMGYIKPRPSLAEPEDGGW